MTKDKTIFIHNVYYMLCYAFQVLRQGEYERVAGEEFSEIEDLFAEILSRGVSRLVKQGFYREYCTRQEVLPVLRGRIEMRGTLEQRMRRSQKAACAYDELTEDNLYNRILKTTLWYLVRADGVQRERKVRLKKLLIFFDGVELLQPGAIPWTKLHYRRGNENYELLMNLCYLVLDGMLQTTEDGQYKVMSFSDAHMERLYEKFILEYYRRHYKELDEVRSAQIPWNLDGDQDPSALQFLPGMHSDVTLRKGERVLILDAKYYSRTMQEQYGRRTLHSANVYQIYAYVKNRDRDHTGLVSGLLLYAGTDEPVTPDCVYSMDGNRIGAKTLNLNRPFGEIAAQLDALADTYLS